MTAGELLDAAHSFPFRPLREKLEDRPFIVVAPHPDDESLACGGSDRRRLPTGTARKGRHCQRRRGLASEQQSLSARPTDGSPRGGSETSGRGARAETGGYAFPSASQIALSLPKAKEAERAIGAIVDCVRKIGARSLFVSWRHDPHCDHQASYRIARQVQRRAGELRLFEYVVWGHTLPPSTEVDPIRSGFRIRIDQEALEKKRRAIAAHRSQTTNLIDDDPAGFLFSQIDLAHFDLPYEFFLESDA